MAVRSAACVLFLVLGSLFTVPASLAIWQERTLLNEDNFVQTVTDVLDDEAVQTAVASRMADVLMVRLDVSGRIDSAVARLDDAPATDEAPASDDGPGLTVLEGPMVSFAREAIFRACLRIVQSDIGAGARELVLRTAHRSFLALVQNDGEYLKATDGSVVLDLRPLLDEAIREVASDRAADAVAERLEPDAGQIVLVESRNQSVVWRLLGWLDDLNPLVPLIALALLVVALLLARDRLRMIGVIGGSLIVTSGLALFLANSPLKELATSWPPRTEGQEAAVAAYEVLLSSFRRQEIYLSLVGVGLVAFSMASRRTRVLREIRAENSRTDNPAEPYGLRLWVRERLTALRAAGLAVAALALLLWPEATPRVFVTVIALLVAYLAVLAVVVSDSSTASSLRGWVSRSVNPSRSPESLEANWVARSSGMLRLAGVVVGAAILLLAPEVTLRLLFLTAVAVMVYLALVDYLASRPRT